MEEPITGTTREVCLQSQLSQVSHNMANSMLAYIYPNDEQELDRLDMQHHMFKMAMDGKLFQVPLQDPKKILDIGTGSGIWPIEMCMITHPSPKFLVSPSQIVYSQRPCFQTPKS